MVSSASKGQHSQFKSRVCNLVEIKCVINLNIVRTRRTGTNGLMKGSMQVRKLRHPQAGWPKFQMLFTLTNR